MYAHKLRGSNDFADLLELLVDRALEDKKPKQSVPMLEVDGSTTNRVAPSPVPLVSDGPSMGLARARKPSMPRDALTRGTVERAARSRYVSVKIKSHALKQANYKCSYVDSISKRECTSTYALEFDHILF